MCGVFGVVAGREPISADLLMRMSALLRHRGPDDEGFLLIDEQSTRALGGTETPSSAFSSSAPFRPSGRIGSEKVGLARAALGHRRLSIVDLSPLGHQPMSYGDRYWVVYNGEIYNHVELREQLIAAGYSFVSQSDTEVILAAFDHWGEQCLHRFNGMWTIALYDKQTGKIWLARDRFGVKPLYWWVAPDGALIFASEIKAFTAHPGWKASLNAQKCHDFLAWGALDHTKETLYAGVNQLGAGCHAWVALPPPGSPPKFEEAKWYHLPNENSTIDYVDAVTSFRDIFTDAVRLRLRADVEVGSCLSGGVDSSSIVCLVNRELRLQAGHPRQSTFSAITREPHLDESRFMRSVIDATGVHGHQVEPDATGLFETLGKLTWHQDEPFGTTSVFAQWCVFKLAGQHGIKVMLDGQGADEQLAGYSSFRGPHLASLLRKAKLLGLGREWKALHKHYGFSHAQIALRIAGSLFPGAIGPLRPLLSGETRAETWLNAARLDVAHRDPISMTGARSSSIQKSSRAQILASNLPMLLHWEDRDSMAHSVEARVPFLDYRLVEFVHGLPDEHKIHEGMTKRVLRDSMSGILPEEVRSRRDKLGFVTPEERWLRTDGSDPFRASIRHAVDASQGIVSPKAIELVESIINGSRPFSPIPWRIVSFGAWMSEFNVKAP